VSANPSGDGGTVTMSVQSRYHIYNDASANLVWRTVLGANDAVAIDPGTKDAGGLQGPIPASRNSNQVELDQVLLPFRDGAQTGLQTIFQQLGPALSNRADLANDLNLFHGIAQAADVGGGALRGEIQDTDLRNLVKNAGQAANALAVGTDASTTQRFIASAANTLGDLGVNAPNLENTIRGFRNAYIYGGQDVFEQYNGEFSRIDTLVRNLRAATPQIVPTLDQFNPTLSNAHVLLTDATPLVHNLAPAVDALANTAKVGVPLIKQLNPGLTDLARTTLPGLAAKYPEEGGKSAYQLIGSTFIGLGVLTDFFGPDGELANLTAGLGQEQSQEFLPCRIDFSGEDLVVCESLQNALATVFSGGTGLLKTLAARPGAGSLYSGLMKTAANAQAGLANARQALTKLSPGTAKALFAPHGGGS
jgi:ABC-type transporter Mla subunit MlaD